MRSNLPKFAALLPDDIKVDYLFDRPPYIIRAIDGLILEGVLGACLTGLKCYYF